MIIFRGVHYVARFLAADPEPLAQAGTTAASIRQADRPVVVFFETWLSEPDINAPVVGESFFTRRGLDVVAIKPAANDWYQQDEITELVAAVLKATQGRRRVGYGGSMGAYAVINFAESLALDDLVAVAPQFSIDPALMPQDWRWRKEAQAVPLRHDKIRLIGRLRCGTLVYDPESEDRPHVLAILAHHDLTPLPVRFAGHHLFLLLQQTQVLPMLAMDLVLGRFDRAAFRRALRAGRRNSPVYWLELARTLCAHAWLRGARRALSRARAMNPGDAFAQDGVQGDILRASGRGEAARMLLLPWRRHSNPIVAEAARYRMAQWDWLDQRSALEADYERAALTGEWRPWEKEAPPPSGWPVQLNGMKQEAG